MKRISFLIAVVFWSSVGLVSERNVNAQDRQVKQFVVHPIGGVRKTEERTTIVIEIEGIDAFPDTPVIDLKN